MFDIGFFELLIIAVVALLVLGPERLPRAARFAGLWVRKARAHWYSVKSEFERELAAEDMRQSIAKPVEDIRRDVADVRASLQDVAGDAREIGDGLRDAAAAARDAGAALEKAADDVRHDVADGVDGAPGGPGEIAPPATDAGRSDAPPALADSTADGAADADATAAADAPTQPSLFRDAS